MMIDNLDPNTLALILLGFRIVATGLIGAVLIKQIHNMRHLETDYPAVRITVFLLTLVLLIGQLIPMTLDAVVAFSDNMIGRHRNPNILSYGYAINNAVKDVTIGALLTFLHFRTQPPKRNKQTGV